MLHHYGQDQRALRDIRDKTVHLHKVEMSYKNINKKLGEKMTTAGEIIWKWKQYKMKIIHSQSEAPYKILPHG